MPLSEADAVVREFDGNLDNRLNFTEFAQFALPATSYSLRDISLKRPNAALLSYSYKYQPLHYTTLRQLGELFEQEMRFQRTRSDLRRELIRHDDFVKSRYFDLLSLGKSYISVDDLIYFLNRQGQRTLTEDLEAILRRCDHTGDQTLNYTEFSELTAYTDEPYNAGYQRASSPTYAGATSHALRASSGARAEERSPEVEPKKDNAIDDSVEQRESPEDKPLGSARKLSARKLDGFEEEEVKDEKQVEPAADESAEQEKPVEYRFLNLLKNQIRVDKKLEIQKEILCSNLQFSSVEAFRMFDLDGKGFVTVDDLA